MLCVISIVIISIIISVGINVIFCFSIIKLYDSIFLIIFSIIIRINSIVNVGIINIRINIVNIIIVNILI